MVKRPSRGRRRTRGQSLVEFALIIPIFLLVLCGILDFGFLLFSRMSVINAAREGARAAAMTSDDTTITTVARSRVTSAASQGGISIASTDVSASCVPTSSATKSSCSWTLHTASNTAGAESGDSVLVTATYHYRMLFPLLFGTQINITSSVQMVLDNVATG